MPQNPLSNKLSSFIGIILLIGIIGFTVFINFFSDKPVEEVKEEKQEIVEEPKFRVLNKTDLANLWRLEKLQTKTLPHQALNKTYIIIDKNFGIINYNPLNEINYDRLPDSIKQYFKKTSSTNSDEEFIVNYGTLAFKNANYTTQESEIKFENIKIKHLNANSADSAKLMEIGNLFLEYQIQSITTKPQLGDFTTIYLEDGREIYLIKQNTVVNGDYYKERLENADYLNDSTKILLPYSTNL